MLDSSKEETSLMIDERDEVERQILKAIEACAKESSNGQQLTRPVSSRVIADNTPYFAHAGQSTPIC